MYWWDIGICGGYCPTIVAILTQGYISRNTFPELWGEFNEN